MAVFMNNGCVVTVNAVDLSDHVTSVTLNRAFNELDVTAMGDGGVKRIKGLEDSNVVIDFLNDTATGEVLQTLQAAWGTNVTVTLKASSGATAATNPLYTFTALVNNTTDINGAVGDLSTQSVTWNVSGTVVVTTS